MPAIRNERTVNIGKGKKTGREQKKEGSEGKRSKKRRGMEDGE